MKTLSITLIILCLQFFAAAASHAASAQTPTTIGGEQPTTTSPFVNMIPYTEPFEATPPYTNQFAIDGTNGWIGMMAPALITSNDVLNSALDDFVSAGNPLPLPGPHTKALCVRPDEAPIGQPRIPRLIALKVDGNTQKVFTDLLWWPLRGAEPSTVTTNDQLSFYPHLNGTLVVWHDDSGTPEWHPLTNSPVVSTGVWVRVTVEQNYVHKRWRIRFNGEDHIDDPKGWNNVSGNTHPGPWFDMVDKGSSMTRIEFEGDSCVDDLVVKSSNPFQESLQLIVR